MKVCTECFFIEVCYGFNGSKHNGSIIYSFYESMYSVQFFFWWNVPMEARFENLMKVRYDTFDGHVHCPQLTDVHSLILMEARCNSTGSMVWKFDEWILFANDDSAVVGRNVERPLMAMMMMPIMIMVMVLMRGMIMIVDKVTIKSSSKRVQGRAQGMNDETKLSIWALSAADFCLRCWSGLFLIFFFFFFFLGFPWNFPWLFWGVMMPDWAADSCLRWWSGMLRRRRRIFRGFHPDPRVLAQIFDKTVVSCFLSGFSAVSLGSKFPAFFGKKLWFPVVPFPIWACHRCWLYFCISYPRNAEM